MDFITVKGQKAGPIGQGTWYLVENPHTFSRECSALQAGIEAGMTLLDTAEMYGDGAAEQLLGQAIRGYDRESLAGERGKRYAGEFATDRYGRKIPRHAHGTGNIGRYTSSTHALMKAVLDLYDRVVDRDLLIRRVNITACDLIPEDAIPEARPVQLDMFTDYEAVERAEEALRSAEERERRLQQATLAIQERFGKNAMLKGMNLMEGGTTMERNGQIGGHKAGDEL